MLAGRFRIVEAIGHGGMGEVYRAEDLELHVPVALKLLPAALAAQPHALERLRDEVRLARRVSHPNVCRVHDLGEDRGRPFLSMDFVSGEDLASLLRRVGRLAGERALEIAREICAGLAAAHAAGVVHRDLKPANVLIDHEGRVRLTDFGLALARDDAGRTREVAGTLGYVAPEQLAGAGASAASDVFALGLVLYEIFTGRRAFAGASIGELLREQRQAPRPPRELVRDLDAEVEQAILHCLELRPERRPPTALAVLTTLCAGDGLRAALAAGQTPTPSAVAAAPVRGAMRPVVAWACLATILVGLAITFSLGRRMSIVETARPPLAPDALAAKAEEVRLALGGPAACADESAGFAYDEDALRALTARPPASPPLAELEHLRSRLLVFRYRCAARPLLPWRHPPAAGPGDEPLADGDAALFLDSRGKLLGWEQRPAKDDSLLPPAAPLAQPVASPAAPLVSSLDRAFALAGFDRAAASRTAPGAPLAGAPILAADGRATWTVATDASPSRPTAVSAAWRAGSLESFRVSPPWALAAPSPRRGGRAAENAPDLLILLLLAASIPLAGRNLAAGSVDRDGVRRLALAVFLAFALGSLIGALRPASLPVARDLLLGALAHALYYSLSAALFYVALEPLVRRLWPERLVSWTRLLAGQLRDPMVGRDVLVGMVATFAISGLTVAGLAAAGVPLVPIPRSLEPLLGLRQCAAATALAGVAAARTALVFLLLLLLFRVVGRLGRMAPLVFFALAVALAAAWLAGAVGEVSIEGGLFALLAGLGWSILLARFGLLAVAAGLFPEFLGMAMPDTLRLGGWYAFCSWWLIGVNLLLALAAAQIATGGRLWRLGALVDEGRSR